MKAPASRGKPLACIAPTSGLGHGSDNRARNHRSDDRRDLTEQPNGAEQHGADTEEEPRLEPEVAKPGRRAEHSGELAFVELVRGAFGRRFRRLRLSPDGVRGFSSGEPRAVRPGTAIESESPPVEHRPKRVIHNENRALAIADLLYSRYAI